MTFTTSIKIAVVKSIYSIGNGLIKLLQGVFFKNLNIEKVQKVIIFRTGSIGDTVCAMPAIDLILKNFPNAKVDLLINSGGTGKVSPIDIVNTNLFHAIIDYSSYSKSELLKLVKSKKYDLFVELSQYDHSLLTLTKHIIFPWVANIKYAFGWQFSNHLLFKRTQEKKLVFISERDRLLNMLVKNGLKQKVAGYILPENKRGFEQLKLEFSFDTDNNHIGIVTGANREKNKWPIQNFFEVMDYFINKGYKIVAFGGTSDYKTFNSFKNQPNLINLCGLISPAMSAMFMENCKFTISNETGPLHLAYAVGNPVIGIFSSREYPGKWFPPNDSNKNVVFRTPNVSCSICMDKACANNICMQAITPQEVIKAGLRLLEINK